MHEAGHYFGLYHTFEGACTNNDCLADGDHVCDTPPDNSTATVPCNSTTNTCTTDADDVSLNNPFRPVAQGGLGDQPDMIINHMDYGLIGCHTQFTSGQKDRMIASLQQRAREPACFTRMLEPLHESCDSCIQYAFQYRQCWYCTHLPKF
ncbi:MAG: hypothetical protein IPP86_06730 [Bacteroidetes bacterium]|nr:hypothetical protein [Bacteroidota bacterium]